MKPIKRIQTTKQIVQMTLESDIEARDNDVRLVCLIWWKQAKQHNINLKEVDALSFIKLMLQHKSIFTNSDVITRARRLVQNEIPSLRGKLWNERHTNEIDVRLNINKI
jgi:hypothetical protein